MASKRHLGDGALGRTLVLALGLVCALPSVATGPILERSISSFHSANESAVTAILRFGRENHIPLGIVLSERLCSTSFADLKIDHASGREALDRLAASIPAYSWHLQWGTVDFVPSDMPAATDQFLSLRVSPYSVPRDTLQAQAAYEWMNIRASLRPTEGTAFSVLSSADSAKWPALSMGPGTVDEVLDRLVGREPGGAWLLIPVEDLGKAADRSPLRFIDYSGNDVAASPCTGVGLRAGGPAF
jgi:hypothetical protein